jgi:hypothetical protein
MLSASGIGSSSDNEESLHRLPDRGVALRGDLLERRAIEDLDVTAPVADEGGALQQARDAFASQVARNIRPSVR